ncbi:MAG: hypothetical protein ABSB56_01325 [Nitrososphaerales archaeon]|jgi:hypothetical protein
MIRELIKSGYERTIGTLKSTFWGLFGPILRRGGLLTVVYVIILVGILGGFVNAVVQQVPNQGLVVYPGQGAQTIAETIIDSFVILTGGAGIYLVYMSGRQTTRARAVNMYLGLALLLLVVSLLAGTQLFLLK